METTGHPEPACRTARRQKDDALGHKMVQQLLPQNSSNEVGGPWQTIDEDVVQVGSKRAGVIRYCRPTPSESWSLTIGVGRLSRTASKLERPNVEDRGRDRAGEDMGGCGSGGEGAGGWDQGCVGTALCARL